MITRLYRVHAAGASIHLEPVPVCIESLDPGYVFVLDTGNKIFLWYGKKAKSTLKSKARLMAEKINKNERKNKAEILTDIMGAESEDLLLHLGVEEHEQKNLQIIVSFLFSICNNCNKNIIKLFKHKFEILFILLLMYLIIISLILCYNHLACFYVRNMWIQTLCLSYPDCIKFNLEWVIWNYRKSRFLMEN